MTSVETRPEALPAHDPTADLDELFKKLPKKFLEPSKRKAAKALLVSIGMCVLGYTVLALAPWYLMPIAWIMCGTAITGLAAVAYDCSNQSFTKYPIVNDFIGMLCMVPLCLPFESWRKYSVPTSNGLSNSAFFWWLSSTWDWCKANFAFTFSKKLIINLVFVYAFVCLFFPLMWYNLGYWALIKFYFIPWLVYHFWMSSFIKASHIVGDDLANCEYPRWVEILSNNMNLCVASALNKMPESVASYNIRQAVQDAKMKAVELQIDMQTKSLMDVLWIDYEALSQIEWPTTIFLFLTPTLAIYGLLTTPVYWQTYVVSFLSYFTGGLAITTAYHRCFSHRSYDMSYPLMVMWTILASSTFEGSVLEWCQDHRAHHRYTDTPGDPYSIKQGFWHAHMGWLIKKRDRWSQSKADISDLKKYAFFRFQHKYFLGFAVTTGIIIPMMICGFGWGDWRGGFFNAGIASTVLAMQCTFFINSLAHWWGDATFTDERTPRDSALVSLVTFGEGYHNFHHEFPYDYRNGVHATAYDPAKWWIWAAEKLGFAWNVKRFDNNLIDKGRLVMKQKQLDKLKAKHDWGIPIEELPEVTWGELLARRDQKASSPSAPVLSEEEQDGVRKPDFNTANFMVINDLAVDVTAFADKHPGGRAFVQSYVGKDATNAFMGAVYSHSLAAKNLLATMRFARVIGPRPDTH